MKKETTKKAIKKQQNLMPTPFDPLGMYGMTPVLPVLDDEPTQDVDDL